MPDGLIDSATLFEVVTHARKDRPSYDWASVACRTATAALLFTPHLHVPPSPIRSGEAEGVYQRLMTGVQELGTTLSGGTPPPPGKVDAIREWAANHVEQIRWSLQNLREDNYYTKWLDAEITWAWNEYARRMTGLFTQDFVPELALVLNVSPAELHNLHEQTRKPSFVASVAKTRHGAAFELLVSAFVITNLLRGRYYSELSRDIDQQLLQHPIRTAEVTRLYSDDLIERRAQTFAGSLAEAYFCNLIANAFFVEKTVENRIGLWKENVALSRRAFLAKPQLRVALAHHVSEWSLARDAAVAVAQQIGLRTYPRFADEAVETATAAGAALSTTFLLHDWLGLAAKLTAYMLEKRHIPRHVMGKITNRTNRLRRLAAAGGGWLSAPVTEKNGA